MNKVKLLPLDVISKIAAGEVIDRPASVVKELLENAIDAGATSIDLTLQDGGKKLIRLKDNGHGIAHDDLETIFLRHATSKISNADDLFDIHSLGFRGEALYSIAAVADIVLTSKATTAFSETNNQQPSTNSETWQIHMRGGEKINLKPNTLSDHGTHIEVNELFFNTPARKKFLKSDTSELNQILNIFIPYCLLKNRVRFFLKNNDKVLIDVKETEDKRERVAKTLNLKKEHMLKTQHTFKDENVSIELIIGDINISRGRRDLQFIFVNNRPVENKNINFHVNNIARLIYPPNKFPAFCLYITLPPENVDVNIHPTKREVKLKDEQKICTMIRNLTENVLMTAGQVKQAVIRDKDESYQSKPGNPAQKAFTSKAPKDNSFDNFFDTPATKNVQPTDQYNFPKPEGATETPPPSLFGAIDDSLPKKFQAARFIGFFRKKYIIFEYGDSMLMVDQHAAQERINYERFIMQMEKGKVESQHLLAPHTIGLNPKEIAAFEEAKERLNACGFECTMFDDQTLAVHTYPTLISDVEKSVHNLLAGDNIVRCDHDTIARRACKASIRAHEKMTEREALFQRDELLRCLDPFTCPHGRPTVIELTEDFLDKQFLRS